jgi:acyl-CoA hydrolase
MSDAGDAVGAMEPKSAKPSKCEMIVHVHPKYLNFWGTMHGGEIMNLMDETSGLAAMRYAASQVTTVGVENMRLIRPIKPGAIAKCRAEVVYAGRTSIEVYTEVVLEDYKTGRETIAAEAYFTSVALDENGKKRPVPPLLIETELQKERADARKKPL